MFLYSFNLCSNTTSHDSHDHERQNINVRWRGEVALSEVALLVSIVSILRESKSSFDRFRIVVICARADVV